MFKIKRRYELVYENLIFDEVVVYFNSIESIFSYINNKLFSDNIRFIISCYDYRNHRYIYNLRSDNSD